MSSFTSPLIGSWDDNMTLFTLTEPFTYYDSNGIHYTVPTGFNTDFASIPNPLKLILSPIGRYGKASVLHDFLYATGSVSRAKADSIFLEAMEVLKVRYLERYAMYYAVRAFGSSHYNKGY